MSNHGCLALRLIKLKPGEEWLNSGPEISFIFPQTGGGKYLSPLATQDLSAGDVLVLNGCAGGKLCVSNDREFEFSFFTTALEHLFPLFATHEISLLRVVTEAFNCPRLYPASSAPAKQCHQLLADAPPQFDLDHRSQLLRAVATILTVEFRNPHTQLDGFIRMEVHMSQVFEKLSSDEILNLSVEELARKFSCSRRHLNRLFHKYFGFSVASLKMEMRLLKAVSFLRNPDIKIINVAEGCGFNHLGLFNTCFKHRFGKSPGEWRKANARIEGVPPPTGALAHHFSTNGLTTWNANLASEGSLQKAQRRMRTPDLTWVVKTSPARRKQVKEFTDNKLSKSNS